MAKITTSINLDIGLARKGKEVLVADLDAQGSLAASLGYQPSNQMKNTLAEILGHIISDEPVSPRRGVLSTMLRA